METEPGVLVHSRRSRDVGAETWLMLAARDASVARQEWDEYGVALLRCGTIFSAVRIPADIVHAAAGTAGRGAVADYLRTALEGPCFFDGNSQAYYALTPHSTARRWNVPDTECLGADFFLGVPATTISEPDPRCAAWWVAPMEGPAALCDPGIVRWLVQRGRIRRSEAAAEEAGKDA
ncbi:hypothetical protein [Streptomyces sp. NRRL B-24572]|uniref:hypothetical protein n=1 Tax=Streptomyces sp. NRRL B-24572 TaxID=1962156 RepID=UPI00117DC8C5|nr:hypothetical protein [Streptomyces sp. NRRL B-24572]